MASSKETTEMATAAAAAATAQDIKSDLPRQARALDIQRTHQITLQPSTSGKWRAHRRQGDKLPALTIEEFDDPVEALEAAEVQIKLGEVRQEEVSLSRLVESLQMGVYVPWPVEDVNGILEWQVREVLTGKELNESRWPGWIACAVEIDRLVREKSNSNSK